MAGPVLSGGMVTVRVTTAVSSPVPVTVTVLVTSGGAVDVLDCGEMISMITVAGPVPSGLAVEVKVMTSVSSPTPVRVTVVVTAGGTTGDVVDGGGEGGEITSITIVPGFVPSGGTVEVRVMISVWPLVPVAVTVVVTSGGITGDAVVWGSMTTTTTVAGSLGSPGGSVLVVVTIRVPVPVSIVDTVTGGGGMIGEVVTGGGSRISTNIISASSVLVGSIVRVRVVAALSVPVPVIVVV